MSEPASISSGIAARYATAIFELAREEKSLTKLEGDVDALDAALKASADLRDLISSPVYTRPQQAAAISAVAQKMGLAELTVHALGLMAGNRRLFVLPHLIAQLRARIADEKGEVVAEVRAATKLTKAQSDKLVETLKAKIGKDIKLETTVDESLIGGLVVKVGSKMIDTSVRAKLTSLQNAMKEVG
ncbi:F0F1 ATP synthase subunit delta [Defluviimonas sp. 20V17]|uniref:ATP synthase subunit delta n=1 Tax=Allgaiera indica TaxID=765699 RepID=A0AAN4ZZE7_9RHOB|nr:F0F1 ATP synthase subunit delta [Allgaiera indica]KDB03776.1 F0F1 ATP synthase subunit delta [Defluviimonas sp. 20V17]GHD99957.1 ATP synthase subunit delta [Allgaiera indica]SDW39888.1 ATP synthase F1 subcomplex delta subunit [Allgaiera indica]